MELRMKICEFFMDLKRILGSKEGVRCNRALFPSHLLDQVGGCLRCRARHLRVMALLKHPLPRSLDTRGTFVTILLLMNKCEFIYFFAILRWGFFSILPREAKEHRPLAGWFL